MSYYSPTWIEILGCSVMYLGHYNELFCWLPIIWLIVAHFRKDTLKDYVRYHCYQAILFNMITSFLPHLVALLVNFISNLISILADIISILGFLENTAKLLVSFTEWFVGIYFILLQILIIYAVLWTLRSKFTYIPPISQAVNLLLR